MNGAGNCARGNVTHGGRTADRLLHELDAEAQSLSPEILDELAASRRHAIMMSQVRVGLPDRRASRPLGSSLPRSARRYLGSLFQSPLMTASLASCCVAALSALMMFNTPQLQSTTTEELAMATPESGMATGMQSVDSAALSITTTASENQATDPAMLMQTDESLDLLGSVDFLLWLDSQQG